mmetsp:Transcript_28883/g.102193  ORF Transcript_28883/g.102193 Transcript_28883/m.102193 type:complete len:263 (-) Transcript_28883:30-818(-)
MPQHRSLELLGGRGGGDLLQHAAALPEPLGGVGLHGLAGHFGQSALLLDCGGGAQNHIFLVVAHFFRRAPEARGRVAQRRAAGVEDVLRHVVFRGAELVAHALVCFLHVGRPSHARTFVKVTDRRPAAGAGRKGRPVRALANLFLRQHYIGKRHLGVAVERAHGLIPCGRLLASSASSVGRDRAHEQSLVGVEGSLDDVLVVGDRKLGAQVKVALRVDGRGGAAQQQHEAAQHRSERHRPASPEPERGGSSLKGPEGAGCYY